MNLKARLTKLEGGADGKALFDMSDAEIDHFLQQSYGLPAGTPLTEDLVWRIIEDAKIKVWSMTHEESLELLQ